ncbi:hypothetical protein GOP47_0020498 [Adiantum capillus-veneris]|uniref:BZIP domain-containing protein n=1 Tax=Adiantum capillus-veneris TaxID=13818 RepID=A0A9D4UA68_ADICA|nr:hypothetical protein GOP47_0020498 [Adiantum capillus-veneris]
MAQSTQKSATWQTEQANLGQQGANSSQSRQIYSSDGYELEFLHLRKAAALAKSQLSQCTSKVSGSKMLVKEEADMETDEREGAIEQRVCKRKKRAVREPDFVYQRRGGRESRSLKKKGRNTQELLWDSRLVKIELDAAQALADFSRLAHLPVRHCPSDLKWSVRRKRTPRSVLKLESQAISKTCGPPCELRTSELESATSLSHGDKTSPNFDCRAESPSSPLPSSKLACRAFLVNGGFTSNLAIRKNVSAEVMRKCIKTEMKDLEPIASSAAKHKSRILKAHVPLCLVKVDPLGEQAISKGEGLQHPKVQPSANLASQLVELRHEMDLAIVDKDKSKTTMTDEDKEARRLRRIQANRESARQTIRKKQLLCEELRRQAASLESENDAMKQKRDMLMQELAFLRGQNYHLKLQGEPLVQLDSDPREWQWPSLDNDGVPLSVFEYTVSFGRRLLFDPTHTSLSTPVRGMTAQCILPAFE